MWTRVSTSPLYKRLHWKACNLLGNGFLSMAAWQVIFREGVVVPPSMVECLVKKAEIPHTTSCKTYEFHTTSMFVTWFFDRQAYLQIFHQGMCPNTTDVTMTLKFPPQIEEQIVQPCGHIYRSHPSQFLSFKELSPTVQQNSVSGTKCCGVF